MKKNLAVMPMVTAMLAVFGVSQAQAELCATKTGQVFSRAQCKAKETVVPGTQGPIAPIGPAGPQGQAGPIGPAGAQGQTGPQGPAGTGISNAPCIQADAANGAWTITFFDTLLNESDVCFVAFDSNGNAKTGSSCIQNMGTGISQVPVVQGNLSLDGDGSVCGFNIQIAKSTGMRWGGWTSMDRTRSVFSGLAGLASGATTVRTNATSTGTRWGAVGATGTAQSASLPEIDPMMLDEAAKAYMKSLSGE